MTDSKPKSAVAPIGRFAAALAVGVALTLAPLSAMAQTPAPAAAPTEVPPGASVPTDPTQLPMPDPKAVVATVGDDTITEADLGFAAADLAQELQQVPGDQQRAFLVTVLIDMKVMAKAAKDAGMDKSEIFQRQMNYLNDRALRQVYFSDKVANAVTPDAVKAAYDKFVADFKPQDEVQASHILVNTEEDAKAIKAQLDGGASFEDLAKEKSIDPSAKQNGGDLGFFSKGQMVPEFEAAAFSMDVGKISDPVKSQFGWHIIKVTNKRKSAPPTIDQVGQQLTQQLMFKSFDDAVAKLKSNVKIDIPDATLADAVKKQNDTQAAQEEQQAAPAPAQ
ncbi:MAG TPA: peptidylprolyl isomerase [Devosiaceae bacterium]|jgi:peptidyl-prolyl cis-trans isomerase C